MKLIKMIIIILFFVFPIWSNFLVTPDMEFRLESKTDRNQISLCRQKEISPLGKNPISSPCFSVPPDLTNLESIMTEDLNQFKEETQWGFYDSLGKQIFPTVLWEGSEGHQLISIVRSKRGSFGVQLQRVRDGAYFFYRTKIQNWMI
ncbi:hypothetical protein P3G55_13815 [Leptospira sp. 96542]|nr:hypothetical protein [Leptospira sp. 96542]